jgi:LTXXQ motif family protein
MKASLLAWTAVALLLTAILVGGVGTTGFAQTATPTGTTSSSTASPSTTSSSAAPAAAPGGTTATHHATTTHTRTASSRPAGETMEQLAEQRSADLRARLHITPQQQSQWDQFAQVMRDNAKDLDQAYQQRAASFNAMNAVENMQSYAQIEQARAQDLQKLVPAFQALYASLSDDQKKQADELFRNQAEKAQQHRAMHAH